MGLLIFYVALALGVSFLCSIMEAVLLSVTPSYVAGKVAQEKPIGRRLQAMKRDVDRPLAAILSLNTIAHTVGAAGAGAQAAIVFGSASLAVVSAVLTFLILILSEIIPKTLGAIYWRSLTPLVVRVLVPTIWSMWPLVKLAQGITWLIARGRTHGTVRRDEFSALAEIGVEEGVLHEDESRIVRGLIQFGELAVDDVMTPSTVVFALKESLTVGDVLSRHPTLAFSRMPVFEETLDEVTGVVLKSDILAAAARDEHSQTLANLKRPVTSVASGTGLRKLLRTLTGEKSHLAIVVGEYGSVLGVVTLEDAFETLIGLEIMDEADAVKDMRALAREQWEARRERMGLE